jgi:two-component system LytT family sensor kinase
MITKHIKYGWIEFAIATALFLVCSIGFYSNGHFNFVFPQLLFVSGMYFGFLTLNFFVWPRYWATKKYFEAVGLTLVVLAVAGLMYTVAFSYLRSWKYDQMNLFHANLDFFSQGFIFALCFLFIYALYVGVREGIIYQYKQSVDTQNLSTRITREVILTGSIWVAILLPLLYLKGTGFLRDFGPFYVFALPYCFALYFINLYWLIPRYKKDPSADGLTYFLSLAGIAILLGVIEMVFLLQFRHFSFMGHLVLHWFAPTLATVVISWWVYISNKERYDQLTSLQTALGTSNANLQYLRSQINPHFLFNALNTLYGTALMEKAERTGEGIQKLGDMMRFMLHENNQDKIALSRELEYIHNYIDLQNMRLALSPEITIDIQIEDMIGYDEIGPMLLIPFIENAYKHGISLQEKSWINVNLYKKENTLHLDVHNSVHAANMNDPERFQSGTGLDNVKQRLQLLYPNRHELVVRQNTKEFFIHLSLTLNQQKLS